MELVPPLVADDNCLGFLLLALGRVSLLQSVVNEQLHILGLVRVDYVEEVLPFWKATRLRFLAKVAGNGWFVLHSRVDVLYRELVKERDVDPLDFIKAEQLLLFGQHLLQKVLVNGVGRRQVQLHYWNRGSVRARVYLQASLK